ncbi:DUF4149 domain-containing protein [Thiomicrorhabdus sp. 6S2-11]|uniref:DUF4149 domain-containing protein n=1 Tax=Thiomicrorhabdus marina TaxID=2818442 RepID=A0ABS3Q344_9GAMM|nr:DUF4149 domain-containing protein [Thiomicrorhabdus marina]MBO1926756.1 DUF4149 domain-containing protein [Thiomicrorhabdus marina]
MTKWRLFLFSLTLLALSLQITMGYVVTPILFTQIDSKSAGDIAGVLFAIFSYFGMAAAVLSLLLIKFIDNLAKLPKWPIMVTLLLTASSHFGLGGWMTQIKARYPQGLDSHSADWALFMQVHGVYQLLYVVVLFVLLGWLWRLLKLDK